MHKYDYKKKTQNDYREKHKYKISFFKKNMKQKIYPPFGKAGQNLVFG